MHQIEKNTEMKHWSKLLPTISSKLHVNARKVNARKICFNDINTQTSEKKMCNLSKINETLM